MMHEWLVHTVMRHILIFFRLIQSDIDIVRKELNCEDAWNKKVLYREAQEEHSIMLEEIWRDEEDLNRHLLSDKYRNVLLVMEMAVEQPEIRFETLLRTNGIEIIEKAKKAA